MNFYKLIINCLNIEQEVEKTAVICVKCMLSLNDNDAAEILAYILNNTSFVPEYDSYTVNIHAVTKNNPSKYTDKVKANINGKEITIFN